MKNFVAVVFIVILSFPVLALAGTAYVPVFIVNGAFGQTDFTETVFQVTNISEEAQDVKIAFYKMDGTPLSVSPSFFAMWVGNQSVTPTITNNVITIAQVPSKQMVDLLFSGDNVNNYKGHATISSTIPGHTSSTVALIATGFIRDSAPSSTSNIYQRAITINGGNPF